MTTATKTKQAPPPVDANSEHRQTRAALQQRLRDRDKIKAALDAATERMNEAHRLVKEFERPLGYANSFEHVYGIVSRAHNDLSSAIPQELANTCKDTELRGQWDDATGLKRAAMRDRQAAFDASRGATQELGTLRSRLTRGRDGLTRPYGEPAILQEGDDLPWATNPVARLVAQVATAILSNVEPVQWAIIGDVIVFKPGAVGAADIERDFVRDWGDRCREVRRTKLAMTAAAERLQVASDGLEVVRAKLIWSAV